MNPTTTEARPLSHLDLETVLVEAWLFNWQPDGDDYKVLLKSVKLRDYETGRHQLAPTVDHCWLWIAGRYWKQTWQMAVATGEQMTLHDSVWLCCTVGPYRRSDGSSDWGLRPRNQFPVSPAQARKIQKANTDLWRRASTLRGQQLANNFTSQCVYQTELEHKAADWREIGRNYKDACTNIRRNINALSRALVSPDSGVTEAMIERLYMEGSACVQQIQARLKEAEK